VFVDTHDDALTLLSLSVVSGSRCELAEAQRALRESRTLNRRRSVNIYAGFRCPVTMTNRWIVWNLAEFGTVIHLLELTG